MLNFFKCIFYRYWDHMILFFFLIFILYWSTVDLQYCVSFRCTAKWFRHIWKKFMYIFCIIFHYRFLQDIEYSSLFYAVNPCCLSILCTVVCICKSHTPNLSLPPSLSPLVNFVFYVCESVSVLYIYSFVLLFRFHI